MTAEFQKKFIPQYVMQEFDQIEIQTESKEQTEQIYYSYYLADEAERGVKRKSKEYQLKIPKQKVTKKAHYTPADTQNIGN